MKHLGGIGKMELCWVVTPESSLSREASSATTSHMGSILTN
jgi:hypothetical protein